MLSFLTPIYLFAAAALIIPVLIHLWNIRPGKVLKVGSISLIEAASRKSSRSFKLLDVPLFILRCLLLLLLAVLLALPVWQKKQPVKKIQGWVLIPKQELATAYKKFKPRIDSLTRAGYEFHYFDEGFDRSDLKQIFLHLQDSLKPRSASTPNYWDMIRQLDQRLAANVPVQLFTANKAAYFKGSRPQVALDLKWQTYTAADSTKSFIQDAWFTPSGDVRVVQGKATPSGTQYNYSNIKPDDTGNSAFIVITNNGQAQISLKDSKQAPTVIDTAVNNMVIYADNKYSLDASYLKAALQAVAQFGQRKFTLRVVGTPSAIPANTKWLFWLSNKSRDASVSQKASHILAYQQGKIVNNISLISNTGQFSTALPDQKQVNLYKQISSGNNKGNILWTNGAGLPILSSIKQGNATIYQFYSHFDPKWNDLVWSDNFPAWLLGLMKEPAKTDEKLYDQRTLTPLQYMPQLTTEKKAVAEKTPLENKDLRNYFWLALVMVVIAERWLAHRNSNLSNA